MRRSGRAVDGRRDGRTHSCDNHDGGTAERREGKGGEKDEHEEIRLRSMGQATAGAAHGLLFHGATRVLLPFLISTIIITSL